MQKAYDLGREREREQQQDRREANNQQDNRGYGQMYRNGRGYDQSNGALPGSHTPLHPRGVRAVNTPWVFIDAEEARRAGYHYTVPL